LNRNGQHEKSTGSIDRQSYLVVGRKNDYEVPYCDAVPNYHWRGRIDAQVTVDETPSSNSNIRSVALG
jgi:hypothetical protein